MGRLQSIRQITVHDLMVLGVGDVAYIKPTVAEGTVNYVIFAADGTMLGAMENRDIAYAAVRQQGLEPVSVH